MKYCSKKIIIFIACVFVVGLAYIVYFNFDKHSSDFDIKMEPYGDGDIYYYLTEDYIFDERVAVEKGYYEAVSIIEDSEYRIFIPIDPQTFERLPTEKYVDGTTIEIEGKNYIIHVQDNNYTATNVIN